LKRQQKNLKLNKTSVMGDAYDLYEGGYLDQFGEYCESFTEMPSRRSKKRPHIFRSPEHCKRGVFNWLESVKPWKKHWEGPNKIVNEYAKFRNWNYDVFSICVEIQKEFRDFMQWYGKTRNVIIKVKNFKNNKTVNIMTTTAETKSPTKVVTGPVRLSYAHIWEPAKAPGSDVAKFSVALIISKDDKKTLDAIRKAIDAGKQLGKETKWKGKIPATLKLPLRDGDEERPDDKNYANSYFLNANSTNRPQIVYMKDGKTHLIENQEDVYSGAFAKVSLNFYPFDTNGSKGVAAGLGNILKWKDGERLSGGSSAEEDFAGQEDTLDSDEGSLLD
jgi:hypothetical protein